ncbi:HlyD family efflux transporter periplasmic adaptor subunit [Mucilaginibacter limnophilus]|uniref:HlyD family efflux transporter periplasmic adaptor subunit n=1 Tax=Mucilaginibacter limnophilus TaxID=1932778 RepID=A0A3S2Y2J4_9SPHI|nr:HlyD family efflux transporter periplasmic adaptor subunit [Mucilaginibacter limnophilus]RVU00437.1 HlyD family efflux transporter periplasmic adaptor subunit [Mucilaginibacter limnophilus]
MTTKKYMLTKSEDTEQIHTEEIQDIISKPPSWLLRWGISSFFAVLLLIVSISALVKYPDLVKAKLRISAINPPAAITATAPGKLIKLLVHNGQHVMINQPLASVESPVGRYILIAINAGQVWFNGIVEENKLLASGQPVFFLCSNNEKFFGEVYIPPYSMGKVKVGQQVLVKLQSYAYEEYGMITGNVSYISEIPAKDGSFIAKIDFGSNKFSRLHKPVQLKYGMQADAEIVTDDTSILKRVLSNLFKIFIN